MGWTGRYRRRKYIAGSSGEIRAVQLDREGQLRPIDVCDRPTKGVDTLLQVVWGRIAEEIALQTAPKVTQTNLLKGTFRYTRESTIRPLRRLKQRSRLSIGTSITPVHLYTEGDSRADSPTEERSRRNRALHLSQAYCLLPAIPRVVRDNSAGLKRNKVPRKPSMETSISPQSFKSRSPKRSHFQVPRRVF